MIRFRRGLKHVVLFDCYHTTDSRNGTYFCEIQMGEPLFLQKVHSSRLPYNVTPIIVLVLSY